MNKVILSKDFKNDLVTREAGEKLRLLLIANLRMKKQIEVDFTGVQIASLSFLHEAFVKLKDDGFSYTSWKDLVILKNIHRLDKKLLEDLLKLK